MSYFPINSSLYSQSFSDLFPPTSERQERKEKPSERAERLQNACRITPLKTRSIDATIVKKEKAKQKAVTFKADTVLKDRTNTIPFKVLKKNSNYTRMKNEDNLFHSSLVQLTDSIQNLSITPTTNEILFQKKIEQLTNLFESTRASPTQFEKGSENIEWIAKINSLLQEKGFDFAKLNADEKRAMKEYGTQLHTLEALDMWITEHTITKLQENFPNLRSLTFTACRISEGVQAKLNKFPDLAQLIFKGCDSRDQLVSRTTK